MIKILAGTLLILIVVIKSDIKTPERANEYDAGFFEQHAKQKDSYLEFGSVLSEVIKKAIEVEKICTEDSNNISLLSVGCGHGLSVEALRASGLPQTYCIEGSESAEQMWPKNYRDFYVIQDLTKVNKEEFQNLFPNKKFQIVLSFEVAEHLEEQFSSTFIEYLTVHEPKLIFFTAATPLQDFGQNPSHVNENTFEYWIDKFQQNNYIVDWPKTIYTRHMITIQKSFHHVWWYGKNMLIFAPLSTRERMEKQLLGHQINNEWFSYCYEMTNDSPIESQWKRDWKQIALLYLAAQKEAQMKLKLHQTKE